MLFQARRVLCGWLIAVGLFGLGLTGVAAQAGGAVFVADVKGIINPVQADYVRRVIDRAEQRGAAAVVLRLDTPGGLDSSMRAIIQRMLSSRVPIMVYVAPPGARAGSAGVYITYAAHVAAMAPNTNIGSATPVLVGEGGESKVSPEMRAKLNNDAVAYIKSLAQQRGRNVEWAEQAVRQGANVTAGEAAQQNIVDFIANDLPHLLEQADGRTVAGSNGPLVLQTAEAPIENLEMSAVERFLHAISDPTIAYILLSLGVLGLTLELYNPGQILPGVVGGLCVLLAFYALGTLPVNFAGLLLIGFAFLLLIADLFAPSHGILTAGGLIAFVLGSLLLFNTPDGAPFLQVSIAAILAMAGLLAAFFALVVGAVARTRDRKPVTGREGMIGQLAEVRTRLAPRGLVHVESELWQARTSGRAVEPNERVRVLAVDGLELTVSPEFAEAPLAEPARAEPAPSVAEPAQAEPAPVLQERRAEPASHG